MHDIKILSVYFEEAVKDAKKGDFIYFAPPYDSDTKTFNSYTDEAKRNINFNDKKEGKLMK